MEVAHCIRLSQHAGKLVLTAGESDVEVAGFAHLVRAVSEALDEDVCPVDESLESLTTVGLANANLPPLGRPPRYTQRLPFVKDMLSEQAARYGRYSLCLGECTNDRSAYNFLVSSKQHGKSPLRQLGDVGKLRAALLLAERVCPVLPPYRVAEAYLRGEVVVGGEAYKFDNLPDAFGDEPFYLPQNLTDCTAGAKMSGRLGTMRAMGVGILRRGPVPDEALSEVVVSQLSKYQSNWFVFVHYEGRSAVFDWPPPKRQVQSELHVFLALICAGKGATLFLPKGKKRTRDDQQKVAHALQDFWSGEDDALGFGPDWFVKGMRLDRDVASFPGSHCRGDALQHEMSGYVEGMREMLAELKERLPEKCEEALAVLLIL